MLALYVYADHVVMLLGTCPASCSKLTIDASRGRNLLFSQIMLYYEQHICVESKFANPRIVKNDPSCSPYDWLVLVALVGWIG